ncbi:epoxide hydrolase family protein [Microbacterium sp. ASV49]|uniref:Alpha/beta fold hydrolase n=1 Tax=Microbacterium candidum TaxID=3041922 RepID=A0ABT7MY10_9MICO|nr:epoxide hydrolase family protein [Microbacterium sp. ASV49]MDL9979325.1 alpha/beta fold hydrolase [Microbacterium sp. ASV49]
MIDTSRAEKFEISFPQEDMDDLRERLRRTRWPALPGDDTGRYGVEQSYMRELVDYWLDEFDWREMERRYNAYDHYRVEVSGEPIHFLRRPSPRADAIPVILTHGWPWTFWHWSRVIDALADPDAHGAPGAPAFDVIVPSYPGFALSSPSRRDDLNFWKIADLWNELMTEVLGCDRYAAGGGDFGALVTAQLGHKHAEHVIGLHVSTPTPLDIFQGERWWDITEGRVSPPDATQEERDGLQKYMRKFVAHIAVHMLDSQTLTYGLSDSPVGLLAWLVRRSQLWVDHDGDLESVFSKDELLGTVTMFWLTNTIGTSIRTYANSAMYPWRPDHDRIPQIEPPTGITFLGFENPPGVTAQQRAEAYISASAQRSPSDRSARWYNLVNVRGHEHGGHFAAWENPDAWIADMRETFRIATQGA